MRTKKQVYDNYKRFKQYKADGIHHISYIVANRFEGYKVTDDRGFTLLTISNNEYLRGAKYEFEEKNKKKIK